MDKIIINKGGVVRNVKNWDISKTLTDESTVIQIFENDSELIGCCSVKGRWIFNLIVNPNKRGLGYGKKLLKTAEDIIAKNYDYSALVPEDNNEQLRKYYSSAGYIPMPGEFLEDDLFNWVMIKEFKNKTMDEKIKKMLETKCIICKSKDICHMANNNEKYCSDFEFFNELK